MWGEGPGRGKGRHKYEPKVDVQGSTARRGGGRDDGGVGEGKPAVQQVRKTEQGPSWREPLLTSLALRDLLGPPGQWGATSES